MRGLKWDNGRYLRKNTFHKITLSLIAIAFMLYLTGCETTVPVKVKPVKIERSTENLHKKLPLRALVLITQNETKYLQRDLDPFFSVNTEFSFPTGYLLKESALHYFKDIFQDVSFYNYPIHDKSVIGVELNVPKMELQNKSGFSSSTVEVTAYVAFKLATLINGIYICKEQTIKGNASETAHGIFSSIYSLLGRAAARAIDDAVKKTTKEIYVSLKNPESMVSRLTQAINTDPTDYGSYIILGNLYNRLGRYDKAITSAKRGIEIASTTQGKNKKEEEANGYEVLGNAYEGKKQYGKAISFYKKAIEIYPKKIPIYFELANVFNKKEDYISAISVLQNAQELAPNYYYIPFRIGLYYMATGKFDEAIKSLNKAIELRTFTGIGIDTSIEDDYIVVKEVMEAGPAKKAGIEIGDRIIKINGQSTKNWTDEKITQNIRGAVDTQVVLTIERKNLKKPIEKTITRKTIIDNSAAPFLGLKSIAYIIKGNIEDAEKDAQKAYSLDPNDDTAKEALGAIYIDKGKYDDALKILSNTSKDNYFARLLEATAYAKDSKYKMAVEIYSSIPEDYLASTSTIRQIYKNAFLKSLIPYANDKEESAKSLEAKGQYKEALNEYAEVLRVANDNEAKKIKANIAKLIKEHPYLAELPEKARKHAMWAEVSTKEGNFENAVEEYKKAIKIAPYSPILYKAIALNYAELKEYRQAINNLKTYLELMPDTTDARIAKDQIYKWEFMMEREKGEK